MDGNKLSLNEWLKIIHSDKVEKVKPNIHFPSNEMLEEYIVTIQDRSEKEVKELLRRFLFPSLTTGSDKISIQYYASISSPENFRKAYLDAGLSPNEIEDKLKDYRKFQDTAYYHRIMNVLYKQTFVWEGISWILDLLPDNPGLAIDTLNAYLVANIGFMPEILIHAIDDAMVVIRSKYINFEHPRDVLLNLKAKEFEILVQELFTKMGYCTGLTQDSHDGGIDIIATKGEFGKRENVLIQCKRYNKNLGVKEIDQVLGMLTRNKASKGILVTASDFSIYAKERHLQNPRIDLINWKDLILNLNKYLGPLWPQKIDVIIRRRGTKMTATNKI